MFRIALVFRFVLMLLLFSVPSFAAEVRPSIITHDNRHLAGTLKDGALHLELAGMAGMVLGVTVLEQPGTRADLDSMTGPVRVEPRKMTLTMQPGPNDKGDTPKVGFVLSEPADYVLSTDRMLLAYGSPTITDKFSAPGPTLVLRRDEPVEVELLNLLTEAIAVHWPGMELEIYSDAAHGFVREPGQATPLIAPGESIIVRFTPRRAGTFMYGTRTHDGRQLSGLYGAVLVKNAGEPPFDARTWGR
jgi:FtsP/CotA-like multicopper oxidase with cupredoxin domain